MIFAGAAEHGGSCDIIPMFVGVQMPPLESWNVAGVPFYMGMADECRIIPDDVAKLPMVTATPNHGGKCMPASAIPKAIANKPDCKSWSRGMRDVSGPFVRRAKSR